MRRWLGPVLGLALAACAAPAPAPLPQAPLPAGGAIRIDAAPVAEHPANVSTICEGLCADWTFVGGLQLTSADTARLHGLSDVEVLSDGRLVAVSDEGDLLRARLLLDAQGRPTGLADATLEPLAGLDGRPLQSKADGDAEGLAVLANGDLLVSFERRHRIWRYPAQGGPPQAVNAPKAAFPENGGMEALAADPDRGPGAYLTGGEDSGQTWTCALTEPCQAGPQLDLEAGFGLVAARRLPGGRTAWLLRSYSPATGNVIRIRILDRAGSLVGTKSISRPDAVDNFEGLAAVPGPDGAVRFYLLSDDNFSASQRTLLFAYDWRPRTP